MKNMTPKDRLLAVLTRQTVDRPPVICMGGMMNAAIVEVMRATGYTLPEAHHDEQGMAKLAAAVCERTGFENIGLPFCMTVEAEVLGSDIDFGSLECEPKIRKERYGSVNDVLFPDLPTLLTSGRIKSILNAIHHASELHPLTPVIGSLTGPISTAASVIDPVTFYKDLMRHPKVAHRVLDHVTHLIGGLAHLMVNAGASVIAIGDPSASGEILGPRLFREYAVPYLEKIINLVHTAEAPVIVHICGNLSSVRHLLPSIRANAISTDAMVNLKALKDEFPQLLTMGNVSTYLLEFGSVGHIARVTRSLVQNGVDIIAPACGLSTSTTLRQIRAMTEAVKENPCVSSH